MKYKIDRESFMNALRREAEIRPIDDVRKRAMTASLAHKHQQLCAAHQSRSIVKQYHAAVDFLSMAARVGKIEAVDYWSIELALDVHDLTNIFLEHNGFEYVTRVAEHMRTPLPQLVNDAFIDSLRAMDVVQPTAGC